MGWESEVGFWESKRRTSSFIRSDTFWWSSSSIAANGFSRKWWKFFVVVFFFFFQILWASDKGFYFVPLVFILCGRGNEQVLFEIGDFVDKDWRVHLTLHTAFAMSLVSVSTTFRCSCCCNWNWYSNDRVSFTLYSIRHDYQLASWAFSRIF